MKLYHGSHIEIQDTDKERAMYFTPDIEVAKQYALGLDDLGNYNPYSFIYAIEIDDNKIQDEDDFMYFDCIGYQDYDNMAEIVYNNECDYYCLKSVDSVKLIENFKN